MKARLPILFAFTLSIFAATQVSAQGDISKPGELTEQSFGDPKAPVTVIEYASLTCHHCRDFHIKTWPAIREKYVNTGKVRFVLREFPLDNLALGGFMLARCSGDLKGMRSSICFIAKTTAGCTPTIRSKPCAAS
jgi:protein-disulfide isomerase